jgi:lysophospholipase L1-like esterase
MLRDAIYAPVVPANGRCFGPAGIKRFEEDVFGACNPVCVLVLEGINDIMLPYAFEQPGEQTNVSLLCEGMTQIVNMAHANNATILVGTVMPFRTDSLPFIRVGNEQRNAFNDWIRSCGYMDGVLDFDESVRDVLQPEYMRAEYHLGDGVHPNHEGGAVMAEIALDMINKENILY